MSLALLTLGLPSVQAQTGGYPGGGYPGSSGGWVPSDSHGTPLTPGMQGTNSDGSANLLPSGKPPKKTNTYPIQDGDPAWWFGAYSPNDCVTSDPYYYYNGLFLSSTANNTTRDNYGALAASYDLNNYNFDRADNLTLPPDLTGSVHADNTDTLTAYFVWTGDPSHIPAHQDFLLRTSLSATAGVSFGNGGATSGLSATGEGMLEGDTVTATAGDAGNDHPAPHTKAVLVRATPTGNLITLSRSAGVSVDTSNSLPYSTWVDSPAPPNASGPGTYYYIGPPSNGQTSATASANASATANTDSRGVTINCPDVEASYYKWAYDSQHGTDRYQHIPQASGNSVDSVVFQQNDPSTGQHFVAGHTYYSNPSGFMSPVFNWKISGDGTADSDTSANLSPSPTNPYGLANLPANLDFGATWDTTQTKTSQFTVDVKDSDGADASDTYTVTWHATAEKFRVLSYQKDVPRLVGSLQSITVNASVPSNLQIPGQEGQIDWGSVQQQAGLPVAVAGAGAGGLLLIPEVAAGPGGWVAIAAQAVAAGASYKLGTASPNHPGTVPIQGNADYNEYCADLNHQVAINSDPSAAGDLVRFKPEALASEAQAAEVDPAHWGSDPYFMNSTAMWQGGWYTDIKDLDGDGYGVNGYTGHVPGHTEVPTHLFKYFRWICTYKPQPQ